eukprot:5656003-Prymnesium_polylepis.2
MLSAYLDPGNLESDLQEGDGGTHRHRDWPRPCPDGPGWLRECRPLDSKSVPAQPLDPSTPLAPPHCRPLDFKSVPAQPLDPSTPLAPPHLRHLCPDVRSHAG